MILALNEAELKAELARLPDWARAAFAASCAQRLVHVCQTFVQRERTIDQAQRIDEAREYVWDHVLVAAEPQRTTSYLDEIIALIPSQEEPDWTPLTSYAENGLTALAYCLRCLLARCDPQEAAWAARHRYEAVDQLVIDSDEISPYEPGGEAALLSRPPIQAELMKQARDLADLQSATESASPVLLAALRQRSTDEQAILLKGDD